MNRNRAQDLEHLNGMQPLLTSLVTFKQLSHGDSYDQHSPESLTCHSILYLPLYSTKKIMRDKLTKALVPVNGFLM
uniref:HECT domain-containing protein n=1 Tax=Dicentrarchus labrax TaxID=13489 RepID=A0A8C4I5F5_DICLA